MNKRFQLLDYSDRVKMRREHIARTEHHAPHLTDVVCVLWDVFDVTPGITECEGRKGCGAESSLKHGFGEYGKQTAFRYNGVKFVFGHNREEKTIVLRRDTQQGPELATFTGGMDKNSITRTFLEAIGA